MTVSRSLQRHQRGWLMAVALIATSVAYQPLASLGATFEPMVLSRDQVKVAGKKIRFASFNGGAFNNKGQIVFYSVIYGQGVNTGNNTGIFSRLQKNKIRLIARANVPLTIAGQSTTLDPLTSNFLINSNGVVLWSGDADGNTNYYLASKSAVSSPIATITGTTSGQEPVVDFNNQKRISIIALAVSLPNSPLSVFRASQGSANRLVSVGDTAVGMPWGSVYESFGSPTLDSSNNVYFTAGVSGKGANYDGIWSGKTADPQPLVLYNRTAPGTDNEKFTSFIDSPRPSQHGKYCAFQAQAGATKGIWVATVATRSIRSVAIDGRSVSTPNGDLTLKNFSPPAVNDNGRVAFIAKATSASGSTKPGLFYSKTPGALEEIISQGDTIKLKGQDVKVTDIRFQSNGGLNSSGKLLVTLSFSNRTSGIFLVTP